ncbi:unnamed protein product [Amaranthus hypochondriacus]
MKKVSQEKWVLDSAASIHVCRDQETFETFEQKGNFGYVQTGDGRKLKVEGLGNVKIRLHDGHVKTFHNVRYVPRARANLISLGKLTRSGYRYVGNGTWCKVYYRDRLVLQGRKADNNICYLDGCVIGKHKLERKKKSEKKVRFNEAVEVFQ